MKKYTTKKLFLKSLFSVYDSGIAFIKNSNALKEIFVFLSKTILFVLAIGIAVQLIIGPSVNTITRSLVSSALEYKYEISDWMSRSIEKEGFVYNAVIATGNKDVAYGIYLQLMARGEYLAAKKMKQAEVIIRARNANH